MAASPDRRISELPLVGALESEQIEGWNATGRAWEPSSLSGLLDEPVLRGPDRVAVVDSEGSWTYRDVHDRANRIARWLRAQGIGAGARVGLFVGRSRHAVTAALATLQAGAAYVPLEPTSPSGRLAFQLADAGVGIVFTDREHVASVPSGPYAVHRLDDDDGGWAGESAEPLRVAVHHDELAYIIYTSGSTGQPKGIRSPRATARCSTPRWRSTSR
jgi:non-ribosomal peptide synthetase component F